jgi:hypothetical protein
MGNGVGVNESQEKKEKYKSKKLSSRSWESDTDTDTHRGRHGKKEEQGPSQTWHKLQHANQKRRKVGHATGQRRPLQPSKTQKSDSNGYGYREEKAKQDEERHGDSIPQGPCL